MRGLICRSLRLELFAGLGILLALPASAATAPQATQTTMSAATSVQNGRTRATVAVSVVGDDGRPATGAVVIEDEGKPLAGVALGADGQARVVLGLAPGDHSLHAVYEGDAKHVTSNSSISTVSAAASGTPSFTIGVAPGSLSLTAGQSGSVAVSVIPVNAAALTSPMFVTLSCSGFPDQSSCTFTPENIEILPNATAAVTSSMVVTTQAKSLATVRPSTGNSVAWAVLLPGTLGLAGLAFSTRRRRWLNRLSLLALIGFVAVMGTSACGARYSYYNHGPPYNVSTPAGTYTLLVTAQSSNGITANTQSTQFVLTVK